MSVISSDAIHHPVSMYNFTYYMHTLLGDLCTLCLCLKIAGEVWAANITVSLERTAE